ncbi:hypothetical protein DXG01_009611 [Tephrocybe rancida]|nr:hypothetical protein DXG01_009611 [Tephrocybe rancida]
MLAVDFKVLDFVSMLFLHVAPNNTGWTDTVETFLAKQGYKLAAEGSLQKRFGNVLVWYNVLQDATTRHVERRHAVEINDGINILQEFEEVEDHDDDDIPIAGLKCGCHEEDTEDSELSNPFPDPAARVRPSDYLRAWCPLCFGGKFLRAHPEHERPDNNHTFSPDAIVCINACFMQKRNRQAQDPPRTHPCTVFIPEQDAEAMEKYADFIRSKKAPTKKRTNTEEPDHLEGSLRMPKSVLDGCEAGFTAADSRCEKAYLRQLFFRLWAPDLSEHLTAHTTPLGNICALFNGA